LSINQDIQSKSLRYSQYDDIVDIEDVTIIIPTLNEELAIGKVIEYTQNEGFMNILIVDGNSEDNTIAIAENYGVKVIQQHGTGKTGAIQTAIEHVVTPYLVLMDGDMTYDAKDIYSFLPHLKNYDEIIGVRKSGRENISRLNRFGNWLINKTFNTFFGTNLNDVCSGLYALNTKFAKDLILNTSGFDVEVEIAAQASLEGDISEVPISFRERIGIQKLRPFHDGAKILSTIVKLGSAYNPVIIYSGLASITALISLIILLWSTIQWINGILYTEFVLFGVTLLLIAIQAINLGIVAAQHKRIERRLIQLNRKNTV